MLLLLHFNKLLPKQYTKSPKKHRKTRTSRAESSWNSAATTLELPLVAGGEGNPAALDFRRFTTYMRTTRDFCQEATENMIKKGSRKSTPYHRPPHQSPTPPPNTNRNNLLQCNIHNATGHNHTGTGCFDLNISDVLEI